MKTSSSFYPNEEMSQAIEQSNKIKYRLYKMKRSSKLPSESTALSRYDVNEDTKYDEKISEVMTQIVGVHKLMNYKGPQLSSLKRATNKGEKCCGGTQPHTHDGINEVDRTSQYHDLQSKLQRLLKLRAEELESRLIKPEEEI